MQQLAPNYRSSKTPGYTKQQLESISIQAIYVWAKTRICGSGSLSPETIPAQPHSNPPIALSRVPLVSWFGGGPGYSAQHGLFTQHGPSEILENSTEPTLREYNLNAHANVLYIDQPIGSGLSYDDGAKVNSTKQSFSYLPPVVVRRIYRVRESRAIGIH